jgi:dTDP-4-dehydrorhamnose reductase
MPLSERHYPILVTGAAGLLGHALGARLAASAPAAGALHLTDLAELDVTDSGAVAGAVRTLRPQTVFHLAAWTDVDGAEDRPEDARRLNVEAAETVARAATGAGARIVHMSTDFIFDGTKPGLYVEDDPPSPVSVYAQTKAEAEARVRAAAPDAHLIVRTAWLYGAGGRDFLDVILQRARAGDPLRVVTDQTGCPTWNEDLADALVAMVESDARGNLHACGAGEASRWDLAVEALRAAGLDTVPERITTSAMPRPARRPPRAVLSTARLAETVGFQFPPWQESVRRYVESMGA